jgi:signal peptidase I
MIRRTAGHGTAEVTPPGEGRLRPSWREIVRIIVVTLVAAFVLKTFVVEAFRIPSASMENTLLVGDFLLVNKLSYGIRLPAWGHSSAALLPSVHVPLFRSVHRGDVVVFEFPGEMDEVKPERTENYIKRCIGLPGDTVEIRRGVVYVNGDVCEFPMHARRPDPMDAFCPASNGRFFPPGSSYTDVDYGPVIVPSRGMSVALTAENAEAWSTFIAREGHALLVSGDGTVMIDGVKKDRYTVEGDYFFVLGDNRENSHDSRHWGFVPEKNIVGEALVVYWSWDVEPGANDLRDRWNAIRWGRLGTLVR